jgi:1-phosphatidylinositol-4-phosphate 5-kinase
MVFQQIRHVFGLNSEEYFLSLGPEQVIGNMVLGNLASLSELCTEGQSGAFFYYSSDGKYMIKTVCKHCTFVCFHVNQS